MRIPFSLWPLQERLEGGSTWNSHFSLIVTSTFITISRSFHKNIEDFKKAEKKDIFLYDCGIQISDRFEINWTVKKALKGLYLFYHLRLNTVWHLQWIDVRAMENIGNEPQKFPGMPQKSKQLECIICQLKKRLNLVNKTLHISTI